MPWPNGYTYKRTVSFDHTQVGSTDQTNFPALIQTTLTDLKTTGNGGQIQHTVTSNGVTVPADLIFTSDSAGTTLLAWEVSAYSASTGAISIWVKVPTVNHLVSDSKIYMWYGNSLVSTYQCTYTDTWDSNYVGVWHFGDGSTLSVNDSTVNGNNGTNHSVTAGAGPFALGAGVFASSGPQYIDCGAGSSLDLAGVSMTMEAWAKYTGSHPGSVQPRIFSKIHNGGSGYNGYELLLNNPGANLGWYCQLAKNNTFSGTTQFAAETDNTWTAIAMSYDQANIRFYKNGSITSTQSVSASCCGSASPTHAMIGVFSDSPGQGWDGSLSEVRISKTNRGGDYFLASYNNQKSGSTFVTISAADVSNVQPSGLASAFASGTPYMGGGEIIATGLASGFAAGRPTIAELNTLFPTGVPTGIGVGVPLVGGGAILPAGVPSAFAPGAPTVLEQQLVGPNGLPSAFQSGLPSMHHSQNIFPTGLPSGEADGIPYILGAVQKIIPTGVGPGLAGIPALEGGSLGMQLYISNVDQTSFLRVETTNIQSQTIGRASATFDLVVTAGAFVPALGQTVVIVDYGNKVFAGCLNSVINELQPYTTTVIYHCAAVDKSSICDHRVINKIYPAGMDAADAVRDIVLNALNGEGITTQGVPDSIAQLSADLNCTFYTVTQAFDAITNDVGGIWWIDFNGVLYFAPLSSLPPCLISLTQTSDNWENLTVENTLLGYANKWYANSNLNVLPGTGNNSGAGPPVVTETYTLPQAAAVARGFFFGAVVLNYSTVQILSVKVNGVQQPVHGGLELINFQKSWWYFAGDPYLTPPNAGNNNPYFPYPAVTSPYPNPGDVVEISYIPAAQNVAVTAGPTLAPAFGTCGSGLYEAVAQVQNVSYQGDLDAISAKLLAKYSQIPKILKFETMLPGVAVGQLLTVDLPLCDLPATTLFVTSVNGTSFGANLGKGSTFKWQVEAATNVDLGNWMKWFERLVGQTENPLPIYQYEQPNWVLGPGGSVAAGVVNTNPYQVKRTGKLIKASFVATTPATNQDMYIDLQTQNGSIFSSPFKIPAGTPAFTEVDWTAFFNDPGGVGYPSYVNQGDIFRPPIVSYAPTGPNPTAAADVTLSLIWQI